MSRLDSELVARGIFRSRTKAKEMIKAGAVAVNGKVADKPSMTVSESDEIESLSLEKQYVGRGALKLKKAAECFGLDFTGLVCLDIGASTGGFTEFMLSQGAAKVYAVDVGHGQLAESLRSDSRVVNLEGTDIRNVTAELIPEEADFISADVSFISLTRILPKMYELLKAGGTAAVLIKPQFEAGKSCIGKHGIVSDLKVHERVLREIDEFASAVGFHCEDYTFSPIKGGSGNIEYLAVLEKNGKQRKCFDFRKLAESAAENLY